MIVNGRKTKEMIIGPILKDPPPDLLLNDTVVDRVSTLKLLGVHASNDLKWTEHVRVVTSKPSSRLHFLKQLKRAGCKEGDLMYVENSGGVLPVVAPNDVAPRWAPLVENRSGTLSVVASEDVASHRTPLVEKSRVLSVAASNGMASRRAPFVEIRSTRSSSAAPIVVAPNRASLVEVRIPTVATTPSVLTSSSYIPSRWMPYVEIAGRPSGIASPPVMASR